MRNPASMAIAVLVALALGAACDEPEPARERARSRSSAIGQAGPEIALLSTRPGSRRTELRFVRPGSDDLGSPRARLDHAPDGEVRGALLPHSHRVVAIADVDRSGDGSWGASLFRLEPEKKPVALADRCYHASRPLVTASGRVFVARGSPGAWPKPGSTELRTDALHVDEIDPDSGSAKTLYQTSGYISYLAGTLGSEIFVYRVAPAIAELIAIDFESSTARTLKSPIAPFARDFSIDPVARVLVYTNRDEQGWLVVSTRIDDGVSSTLARGENMSITPHAWPGGGTLMNDGRGATVIGGSGLDRPLGPGFDELRALSVDERWAVLAHAGAGKFAQPFAVDRNAKQAFVLAVPAGERADIAGIVE